MIFGAKAGLSDLHAVARKCRSAGPTIFHFPASIGFYLLRKF